MVAACAHLGLCYLLKYKTLDPANSEAFLSQCFKMIDICTEHLESSIELSSFNKIGNLAWLRTVKYEFESAIYSIQMCWREDDKRFKEAHDKVMKMEQSPYLPICGEEHKCLMKLRSAD